MYRMYTYIYFYICKYIYYDEASAYNIIYDEASVNRAKYFTK